MSPWLKKEYDPEAQTILYLRIRLLIEYFASGQNRLQSIRSNDFLLQCVGKISLL